MRKIFDGCGMVVIGVLILFFLIAAPSDVSNVESKVVPLEKKSIEISRKIDYLDQEISFLKENDLKRQLMIEDLLTYLKTKKGKKYVERLFVK